MIKDYRAGIKKAKANKAEQTKTAITTGADTLTFKFIPTLPGATNSSKLAGFNSGSSAEAASLE